MGISVYYDLIVLAWLVSNAADKNKNYTMNNASAAAALLLGWAGRMIDLRRIFRNRPRCFAGGRSSLFFVEAMLRASRRCCTPGALRHFWCSSPSQTAGALLSRGSIGNAGRMMRREPRAAKRFDFLLACSVAKNGAMLQYSTMMMMVVASSHAGSALRAFLSLSSSVVEKPSLIATFLQQFARNPAAPNLTVRHHDASAVPFFGRGKY